MAKAQIDVQVPRRIEVHINFEKKAATMCVGAKHKATSPATSNTAESYHNHPSSARVGRNGGSRSLAARPEAAASQQGRTGGIRNIWHSSQNLITLKANPALPASLIRKKGSPSLVPRGEASSPASDMAKPEAASRHKSMYMFAKKREAVFCSPVAKAGTTPSACKSKDSLHSIAKANSGFAAGHLNYLKTLTPNKGQKRGTCRLFEEPWRPLPHKKAKREPFDARRAVQQRLSMFRELAMKLQRDKETKPDMKACKLLKERGGIPTRKYLGEVPGVEVGDEFYYRAELMVTGLHGSPIAGIDSMPFKGTKVATCVISSKDYVNIMEGSDVLVYSGEGGNPRFESTRKGPPGDQRLDRGNLALKNSMDAQTPVRVVHGFRVQRGSGESLESRANTAAKYVYVGLYLVEDFWWETGWKDFRVLKFRMRRMPGQPKLELKQVWRSKTARKRPGPCINVVGRDSRGEPERVGRGSM